MTEQINPNDPQELEDFLAEAIDDTLDMDWTGRVGAKGVLRTLEAEGLMIVRKNDLRDQFAGQALAGEMACQSEATGEWGNNSGDRHLLERAKFFYRFADAMIEARKL